MGTLTGRKGPALYLWIVVALGCIFSAAGPARAAKVAVAPVNISITRDQHSALLTVTNEDSQPVRFSLSTYAWAQSETGAMELKPTTDIIFFPAQLTLAAGESRNIRLGTQVTPGDVERTYRIFLDELPEPAVAGSTHTMKIHVLTKIGIPIFIVPDKVTKQAQLTNLAAHKSALSFQVQNTGNVHVLPGPVSVVAGDAADKTMFSTTVNVWYVLAGGTRTVNVAVPKQACAHIRSVNISAKIGQTNLTRSLQTPSGVCSS